MLEKTYAFFTKQAGFNRDLTFTDRGFEQIFRFFGSTVLPSAKDAAPNQFYDTRIIDKLKKSLSPGGQWSSSRGCVARLASR